MDKPEDMVRDPYETQRGLSRDQSNHRPYPQENAKGVLKEQYITIGYKAENEPQRLKLRRITFKADDGKVYVFITNNFTLPATQIALVYRYRWMIELLFKQIKQNFSVRYFWGNSENAIKVQVYCVLNSSTFNGRGPQKSRNKKVIR